MNEPFSYQQQIIVSIHESNINDLHSNRQKGLSLRSPWLSIFKTWSQFEDFDMVEGFSFGRVSSYLTLL